MGLGGHFQVVLLAIALQVQGAQPVSHGGLVVGQVIDAVSKRPVAGVVVALVGPPGRNGQPRLPVLTGTDGRFVFRDMPRGNYNLNAIKPGYVDGAHGRTRPGGPSAPLAINEGERRGDIVLRLWRHAAISGTVTDESGERQVGIQVRAYRRTAAAGKRRYAAAGVASTDDRGIYRIGTLTPGDYIVGTAPRHLSVPLSLMRDGGLESQQMAAELTGRGGALVLRDAGYVLGPGSPTPPPPAGGRLVVYPPIYHPSAPAGEAASVIPLLPGQDHDGADIQIAPVSSVSVAGFIMGPDGPVTATPVRLVPAGATEVPAAADGLSTITDRQGGGFIFPAVPSGYYTLKLNRGLSSGFPGRGGIEPAVIWVDLPLTVGTEDIENLGVTANAGIRISGRFEFEGDPSRPRGSLQNVQITIVPADLVAGTLERPVVARPNGFGEFTSPPLPGGRYYVRIADSPAGWMFKAATVEGRDVADTPLTLSSDTTNVTLQFTDRWSGLGGRVQVDRGPATDAAVVVFPTDLDAWGSSGQFSRRLRMTRVAAGGEYSFNLPAGDYYVIAIPDEQAADWQDPDFLAEASREAIRVRIGDGERTLQDVRLRVTR